jgi:bifunctional non-homologous end joining protein LigD
MGLTEYRRKRNFRRTPEPRGKRGRRHEELVFVIQKHDASRLHYDFRLELDGVLKSWAVPKGPDIDPANKRLAMQVEDHPLEYGDFEGVIPQDEYGGGTVMLWDKGVWEPLEDAKKGLREGHLKFALHGNKLQGRWMLVRKGGRAAPEERHWFLFKERDEFARRGKSITEKMPLSVTTGTRKVLISAAIRITIVKKLANCWRQDARARGSLSRKRRKSRK